MMRVKVAGVELEVLHLQPRVQAGARLRPSSELPTLVFLHEGLGSVAMWHARQPWWTQALCDALGWSGLVYSRRGYGHSESITDVRGAGRLGPDYLHRQAWDTLPQLLQQLDIHKPVPIGHSDGASIALLYAARHALPACVAMAPHWLVEPVCISAIKQAKAAYEQGSLRQRLQAFHDDVDSAFWQWCDVWLSEPFSHLNLQAECSAIACPLLALQGRQDAYGTLLQIEGLQPQAFIERVVLEDCGHSPHRDQPEQALRHIAGFLQAQCDL